MSKIGKILKNCSREKREAFRAYSTQAYNVWASVLSLKEGHLVGCIAVFSLHSLDGI